MNHLLRTFWSDTEGQDIAEYAVMLAVILVIVVGTIRLIGSNANTVFSTAASAIQWSWFIKRERSPHSMDNIVLIMFGFVLCAMTALCFMELRRIRKKLESTVKDGGVQKLRAAWFRNALTVWKFGNSVLGRIGSTSRRSSAVSSLRGGRAEACPDLSCPDL
jgi:Flp pilus assembly pilin Flp